jgi:hypothetical protein
LDHLWVRLYWTKEVGCQARTLKRWVGRPMVEEVGYQDHDNSLHVRELLRIKSQGAKMQLHGFETHYPTYC